jgi:hypothetical protein
MTNGLPNLNALPPPQPSDPPGTRPATNWPRVVEMVLAVQGKLAEERAGRLAAKQDQKKVEAGQ